jgi:hypothetical protein
MRHELQRMKMGGRWLFSQRSSWEKKDFNTIMWFLTGTSLLG